MDEINRQVRRAQRLLMGQQFLAIVFWSLFATLMIGAVGLGIPKIWVLSLNHEVWNGAWLGGSFGVGLVVALVWSWLVRRSAIDAAIELDRRYGLKERVSSTLALNPEELRSEIGQALVADATRNVRRVDLREQFRIQPSWRLALPLVPAAVITGLLFVPNASLENRVAANAPQAELVKKTIQAQIAKLNQIAARNQRPDKSADALQTDQLLRDIGRRFTELGQGEERPRKEVQIKIYDLIKDAENRRQELGGAQELRRQLGKLNAAKGPAEKLAAAIKDGNLQQAREQLNQLQADLQAGKLNDEQKEQLSQQMNQLKDQLREQAAEAKEARRKLEQEVAKKLAQGDAEGAKQLQDKLDQLNKQGQPAEQMINNLAEKIGQAADAMQDGGGKNGQDAGQKLDELAKALKDAQDQLEQLKNLEEMLDQLAEAKDALNGKGGKAGKGDLAGDNLGQGNQGNKNGLPGDGNGNGRGQGKRNENEVKTNPYASKVDANSKEGETYRTDNAGGENQRVQTRQSIKAEIEAAAHQPLEAMNDVKLPREQRNHSDQYFNRLRNGLK